MFIKKSATGLFLTALNRFSSSPIKFQNKMPVLNAPICITCGTQYPLSLPIPAVCPICSDDRQYIGDNGQIWQDLEALDIAYTVKINRINAQLYELKMTPNFAIGQRSFLVLNPAGNILWDCIPLLNEEVIDFIRAKGGLKAIAFSHPHYYSTMNDWARVFNCSVYIHSCDQDWVFYKGPSVKFWSGHELELWENMKIIHVGGHFPGSSIFHIASTSTKGTVLCGDTLYISRSKRHIAVMHSFPNQIMLTKNEFASVFENTKGLEFDTLHGAFDWQNLSGNANEIFKRSMNRYINSYEG